MREEIIKLLDQYRLKEALSQMTGYATHTSDWQLKNELEALQTSYDLMLQYTSKGMKDPNKVEIYHKMLRTAYELADRIHIAVQATQNYGAYYDTMRTFVQSPPHSYAELQMQLEAYTEDMAGCCTAQCTGYRWGTESVQHESYTARHAWQRRLRQQEKHTDS